MSITWDYPQSFILPVQVEQHHIDDLNHTNNGVYTGWCEQIAWAHSAELGLTGKDYRELNIAMAIHEANYQYLAPSFLGEDIAVATWLTACDGRLTMQRSFQMINQKTGQTLFRGQWQLVCINLSTNKPTRMPKIFIDTYVSAVVTD
ncbi:MAG: acyl-CoA thioesterase [Oceanicoccus sp.]|uniref:acyl-CoA thioesterase n=1 Tax=Oceanicoccus sp. TaxID=2691044 RepID=UPI00260BD641|nr:thioesterase family protein [Oceanicoccus sp.]MCP3907308.1 acyl-CoA thioesterase [Oceanicoccus sp.]MDG1773775.1 thioesterase family protein [Oceanicoccus sp.]